MRLRKVERGKDWRKTSHADAGIGCRIWTLHTRPFVMSRALLQKDFVVLPKSEVRRIEAQSQQGRDERKPYECMPPSGGDALTIGISTTHAFTESLVATSGPTKRRKLETAYVHSEQCTIERKVTNG